MQKRKKNLLSVFGAVSGVIGVFGAIASFLKSSYAGLGISAIFIITSLILLALAYGE